MKHRTNLLSSRNHLFLQNRIVFPIVFKNLLGIQKGIDAEVCVEREIFINTFSKWHSMVGCHDPLHFMFEVQQLREKIKDPPWLNRFRPRAAATDLYFRVLTAEQGRTWELGRKGFWSLAKECIKEQEVFWKRSLAKKLLCLCKVCATWGPLRLQFQEEILSRQKLPLST